MSRLVLLTILTACAPVPDSSPEGEDSDEPGVECGDPVTYDIEITAKVVSADKPAEGIEVGLDDRGYTGEILGSGSTAKNGTVTFTAVGVTSLADCWGTVLNYQVVATDPADSSRTAEDGVNTQLYAAIDDGSLDVDLTDFPLEL